MPEAAVPMLVVVIGLALTFDFINGFHDAANAVATSIATRVLPPTVAILMGAALNFLGALSGTAVAKTVGSGIVGADVPLLAVAAALVGAITWNLITWWFGLPSSSSHTLIGSVLGAGVGALGFSTVKWSVLWTKVIVPMLASPVAGFIVATLFMRFLSVLVAYQSPARVGAFFRRAQIVSAAFMAFSHGSNDAQKTMGVITLSLVAGGVLRSFDVPTWVILLSALAMGGGTAAGGRRIIHTMGTRLTHLEPVHGFAAETSAAAIIETASRFGFPLSTTHAISSTILGVGAARRLSAVRWNVVRSMVQAWILTIPVSAAFSFAVYEVLAFATGRR